jgi:hypothetical protein
MEEIDDNFFKSKKPIESDNDYFIYKLNQLSKNEYFYDITHNNLDNKTFLNKTFFTNTIFNKELKAIYKDTDLFLNILDINTNQTDTNINTIIYDISNYVSLRYFYENLHSKNNIINYKLMINELAPFLKSNTICNYYLSPDNLLINKITFKPKILYKFNVNNVNVNLKDDLYNYIKNTKIEGISGLDKLF